MPGAPVTTAPHRGAGPAQGRAVPAGALRPARDRWSGPGGTGRRKRAGGDGRGRAGPGRAGEGRARQGRGGPPRRPRRPRVPPTIPVARGPSRSLVPPGRRGSCRRDGEAGSTGSTANAVTAGRRPSRRRGGRPGTQVQVCVPEAAPRTPLGPRSPAEGRPPRPELRAPPEPRRARRRTGGGRDAVGRRPEWRRAGKPRAVRRPRSPRGVAGLSPGRQRGPGGGPGRGWRGRWRPRRRGGAGRSPRSGGR